MNTQIKDIIAKLVTGLAEDKLPLVAELETAIEQHVSEVIAEQKKPEPEKKRSETWPAREASDSYRAERGQKQDLFRPEVTPSVPTPPDYSQLLSHKRT